MDMDRDREIQLLQEKLARCRRLAREFTDGVTNENLRELARELEQQLRILEH